MESDSDEQLLRRSAGGETQQFAVLWDRHRDRVFRHLVAATRDTFLAEDLTATAFLELWRRRRSVRFVDGSALPWLLVTASNLARNGRRGIRRYQTSLSRLPPPAPSPDPQDAYTGVNDERLDAVREVMRTVDTSDRDLLLLTAVEGARVVTKADHLAAAEG